MADTPENIENTPVEDPLDTKETAENIAEDIKPEIIERKDQLVVRELDAGIKRTTTVPTDITQEGTIRLFDDGSAFRLYAFLTGSWRKLGDAAFITGFTSRVRAHRATSAQTIPNVTFTKVQLNVEDYDGDAEFDSTTNYRFTAKKAGFYAVSAGIYYDSPIADKRYDAAIYKNGVKFTATSLDHAATTALVIPISDIIELAVDDFLELFTYHEAGANETVSHAGLLTFMAIHRLS